METFILTTTDGAEHKIVASDIHVALVSWLQGYQGKYIVDDVLGIHNQEA